MLDPLCTAEPTKNTSYRDPDGGFQHRSVTTSGAASDLITVVDESDRELRRPAPSDLPPRQVVQPLSVLSINLIVGRNAARKSRDEIRRARNALDLLVRKSQSVLRALHVQSSDEAAEAARPITLPIP